MRRLCRRSSLARPNIWRFRPLSQCTLPSVWSVLYLLSVFRFGVILDPRSGRSRTSSPRPLPDDIDLIGRQPARTSVFTALRSCPSRTPAGHGRHFLPAVSPICCTIVILLLCYEHYDNESTRNVAG